MAGLDSRVCMAGLISRVCPGGTMPNTAQWTVWGTTTNFGWGGKGVGADLVYRQCDRLCMQDDNLKANFRPILGS